jgi:hypothetical protein
MLRIPARTVKRTASYSENPVCQGKEWFEDFFLIEASAARQAVGKCREGPLWSSLGYVGNGSLLSTYPDLSIGTRMRPRPSMCVDFKPPIIFVPLRRDPEKGHSVVPKWNGKLPLSRQ